jgi:hypothetical protein
MIRGEGIYNMTPDKFARFGSPGEFLDELKSRRVRVDHNSGWSGETEQELEERSRNGYTGAVPEAEKLLAGIDASLNMHGLTPRWNRAPVGAFPCVPSYLANDPDSMLRIDRVVAPRGEINVYYCPMTSSGVYHEESFRRGVVVLAAIMALSRVRPVNAYYVTCMGLGDHIIKLRTNPMVLSESAYVLTSCAFYRTWAYSWGHDTAGWDGGWGAWSGQYTRDEADAKVAHMKTCLGLGDEDVMIPGMHLYDLGIMRDPVKWINGLLDRYRM